MSGRYHVNHSTKIARLADQAHEESNAIYYKRLKSERADGVIFFDIFNQRFAELIVLECVSYCGSQADRKNIQKHFDLPVESSVQYEAPTLDNSITSQYTRKYNLPKDTKND